jgi:excisionase family DNA binding protein
MEMLYTLQEVAEILKVSTKSIYRYVESQKLKASKVGGQWRIKEKDLNNFIGNK